MEALDLRALREVVEDREREAEAMLPTSVPKALSDAEAAIRVQDALQSGPALDTYVQGEPGFAEAMKSAYPGDTTFSKVLAAPKAHPTFAESQGLLYVTNRFGHKVLCVPYGRLKSRSLHELVIDHAHRTLGHLGAQKTAEYVRR